MVKQKYIDAYNKDPTGNLMHIFGLPLFSPYNQGFNISMESMKMNFSEVFSILIMSHAHFFATQIY